MNETKKCLVTGCSGFIGSHISKRLILDGYQVVGLDDLSGGFVENNPSEMIFVKGSILDDRLINHMFDKYRFDYVYHLAAYAAEGLSHFIKRFNYTNNLIGSVNLINASIKTESVKCFVFSSSIAVYGKNQVPMIEESTPMPEDPYGIAKYAVELDLKESHEMFGMNYIIFRPHNVYGEGQNIGDRYRNVIGIFMNNIMKGEPLPVFGDGLQTRAFSYIDDVAPIIAKSVERKNCYNQVFNVGADKPYSVAQLADIVSKAMGVKTQIKYLEARKEVINAFSSHEKVNTCFHDLIQNVPLEEGIPRMVEWAKKLGYRKSTKFRNIEIQKNLPPSWQEAIE